MAVIAALPGLLVLFIVIGLFLRSKAILGVEPLSRFLFSSAWSPMKGEFGLLPFIAGTMWVTLTALALAVPVSILTAIYLSEYAPRWARRAAQPVIDLLAGLPSVVYGAWGVILVVPFVGNVLAPLAGVYSSGYSILAGGIILAIMTFPTIIHVTLEVFASVPRALREASLSLGATKWETTRHVVLRKGAQGILAASVLGFSRALGETMAVLMVVGNVPSVPRSLFDPGYPLPALIANNYGEMMSIPRYDAALMMAALVLMLIVLAFNVLARGILIRVERKVR
ncbi:MAG TPA: phosphate ABC transporter permease subunit PstC [Candidatus Aminicenantes bacterium]|nr:phosphate ABC transporter permease subunit PstC [Candidatus Aminicenantes bacterium]